MSLKRKPIHQQRLHVSSRNFSSLSMGAYSIPKISTGISQGAPVTPVTINRSLLAPLKIDIDPAVQAVRTQEKEQIKSLNNRFASFIEKVRFLEQQNKMLETKWKLLQEQTATANNTEPMLKSYIAKLQKQLDLLNNDKQKLDMEKDFMHKNVANYQTKYEQESNKRNNAEMEFVMLKKDVDIGYLSKMNLHDMVSALSSEIMFFRAVYDEEIREMQESLKETSVVLQMDNSRGLNMDHVIAEVKAQYEEIAAHSRKEVENSYKTKFNQMAANADQYANELRTTKGEISGLTRTINHLRNEIEIAQVQRGNFEAKVAQAEQSGVEAVQDAKARIGDLEKALQRAKQGMARQIREYQELMNVKLALDIEISTYKKLLEGEEERLGQGSLVNIKMVPMKSVQVENHNTHTQRKPGPVFIKTVETQDTLYSQDRKDTADRM
ncbi:keratin, type II cytoskeletal 8-like [Anabas testudineus]|nr:keratin, type II cytoskeletal 8-like [Anabas testudineus]